MLLLAAAPAFADDPPAEEAPATPPAAEPKPEEPAPGEVIRIQVTDDMGSALDGFTEKSIAYQLEDPARLDEFLDDELLPPPVRVRGRFYAKPALSIAHLDDRTALRLGATGGHRWWQLGDEPVIFGGETRLEASAPVGGARGYAFALGAFAGPWMGPVGFRIGPNLRADRSVWGDTTLPAVLALGAQATVSIDAEVVQAYVGVEPAWYLAGDRASVDWASSSIPGFGDDLSWLAGVAAPVGMFQLLAQGTLQATPVGPLWDLQLGVHFQPF